MQEPTMQRLWLRAESLVITAALLVALSYFHAWPGGWLTAASLIAPDLALLGYLVGPRLGGVCYNAVHSYIGPATLAMVAVWTPAVLPFAGLWALHIAVDRVVGYGMKSMENPKVTHLSLFPE